MSVIVITGASSGVGHATAIHLAGQGHTICALARSRRSMADIPPDLESLIHFYPTDVTKIDQVETSFASIIEDHKTIDVLVNNAGVAAGARDSMSAKTVDYIIDTNLKGTMYCTFAVIPVMRKQRSGRIINIASIAGVDIPENGNPGVYAASKHGVIAFGDALGRMVRKDGILITALSPGGIDTALWNEDNPYRFDKSKRIKPEEVADLISYVLKQPERTHFKNIIFVPTGETW